MKDKIQNIINEHKFIFDQFPELKKLPIYTWGRYYKYECAGESFEYCVEDDCYEGFEFAIHDQDLQSDILQEIDKLKETDIDFETKNADALLPSREECVTYFKWDDRAGKALIIVKDEKGKFRIDCVDCDSPE